MLKEEFCDNCQVNDLYKHLYVNILHPSACPITVPIMDTSRITAQGDGLRQVAVNRQSYFHVNTRSAGDADLQVRVTGSVTMVILVGRVTGHYQECLLPWRLVQRLTSVTKMTN